MLFLSCPSNLFSKLKKQIINWDKDENPEETHSTLSPNCKFNFKITEEEISFDSLDVDSLTLIFEFFSFESSEILKLQLISKSISQIIPNLETLWEDISRQKWVYVSNSLKTKSWFHFFKKRFTTLLKSKNEQGDALPIEECAEWDFHCPSKFFKILTQKFLLIP
jgi:hypothetical protein